MNRQIINTNIRLNLSRPEDWKAWYYLQEMDRKKYKYYSRAVVAAVNDFFCRQEKLEDDPYLETREKEDAFLQRIEDTVRKTIEKTRPVIQITQGGVQISTQEPTADEDEETEEERMNAQLAMEALQAMGLMD